DDDDGLIVSDNDSYDDSDDNNDMTDDVTNGPPPPQPPDNSAAEARIKELEKQVADLLASEKDSSKLEAQIKALMTERDTYRSKIDANDKEYERKLKEYEKTQSELQKARKDLEEVLEKVRNESADKLEAFERKSDDLQKQVNDLKEAKDQLQSVFDQKVRDYKDLEQRFDSLKQENVNLAEEAASLKEGDDGKIAELQAKEKRLQKEARKLKEQIDAKEKQIQQLKSEKEGITKALNDAKDASKSFDRKLAEIAAENRRTLAAKLKEKETELQKRITELTVELGKLQTSDALTVANNIALQARIAEKEGEITKLTEQLKSLQQRQAEEIKRQTAELVKLQTQKLEGDVLDKAAQIEQLTNTISENETRIASLQRELADYKQRVVDLTATISMLETSLQNLPNDATVQALRVELQKVRELAGSTTTALQNQLTAEQQATASLRRALEEKDADYAKKLTEMKVNWEARERAYVQSITEKDGQIRELERNLAQSKAELDELRNAKAHLEEQIQANDAKIAELTAAIIAKQTENRELAEDYAKLLESVKGIAQLFKADNVDDIIQSVTTLLKSIEERNKTIEARDQTITEKEGEIKMKEKEIEELKKVQKELTAYIGDKAYLDQARQGHTLSELVQEMSRLIRGIQGDLEKSKTELNEAQKNNTALHTAYDASQKQIEPLVQEKKVLNDEIKKLQDQITELNRANDGLLQQKNTVNQQLTNVRRELESAQADITKANQQKLGIEREFAAANENTTIQIRDLNEKHQQEIANLNKQIEDKDRIIQDLNIKIQDLDGQIAKQKSEIENLWNQLDVQIRANEKLEKAMEQAMIELEDMRNATESLRLLNRRERRYAPPQRRMREAEEPMEAEVSENPPKVEISLSGRTVQYINQSTGEIVQVQRLRTRDKKGKIRSVYLVTRFNEKRQPVDTYFANRHLTRIPVERWSEFGIPYRNELQLNQEALFAAINRRNEQNKDVDNENVIRNQNPQATISENLKWIADNPKDPGPVSVNDNLSIRTDDVPPKNDLDVTADEVENETDPPPPLLIDDAGLLPIFREFSLKAKNAKYAIPLEQLLRRIKKWTEENIPSKEGRWKFLTDEHYVLPDRLQIIGEQTPSGNPGEIWDKVIGAAKFADGKQLPPGFKYWLRMWADRFKTGASINLDPKLIYHIISSVLWDITPKKDTIMAGFGYMGNQTGRIPIPTARDTVGFYDYTGYGFDPFRKQLHNPPSYYANDYYGYYH
ncbi:MAG: hypothetical protein J6Y78_03710, partial [Paludibacteraceae bacterium]|nr:hypothetical protein [Paludibacteraceae bacterium]